MVFFIIFLALWAIIGGISFMCMYVDVDDDQFQPSWHILNNLQKRFVYVVHGPLVLVIATVSLTIRKLYQIISNSYESVMNLLGKAGNND